MRKGFAPIIIISSAALLLIVGVAAFVLQVKFFSKNKIPSPTPVAQAPTQPSIKPQASPSPRATLAPTSNDYTKIFSDGSRFVSKKVGISLVTPVGSRIETFPRCLFREDKYNSIRIFYYQGNMKPESAFSTHLDEGVAVDICRIANTGKSIPEVANQELKGKTVDPIKSNSISGYFAYYTAQENSFGGNEYWIALFQAGDKTFISSIEFSGTYVSNYKDIAKKIVESIEAID